MIDRNWRLALRMFYDHNDGLEWLGGMGMLVHGMTGVWAWSRSRSVVHHLCYGVKGVQNGSLLITICELESMLHDDSSLDWRCIYGRTITKAINSTCYSFQICFRLENSSFITACLPLPIANSNFQREKLPVKNPQVYPMTYPTTFSESKPPTPHLCMY